MCRTGGEGGVVPEGVVVPPRKATLKIGTVDRGPGLHPTRSPRRPAHRPRSGRRRRNRGRRGRLLRARRRTRGARRGDGGQLGGPRRPPGPSNTLRPAPTRRPTRQSASGQAEPPVVRRPVRRGVGADSVRSEPCTSTPSRVSTASGVVEGFTRDGVNRWRSIPYAVPPVGPLRFRAPEPIQPWLVKGCHRYTACAPNTASTR